MSALEPQQTKKTREIRCKSCALVIKFDKNVKGKNGKLIPLEENGSKHQCPNSTYAKLQFKCKACNAPIKFDKAIRSKNGKAIPLNIDNSKHD
jgi:hypothetical protein